MYDIIIKPSGNSSVLRPVPPPYFMSHLGTQFLKKNTSRKLSNFHYSNKKYEISFNIISKEH